MKLAVITIGQSPRSDLTPELAALLPPVTELIEHGALDRQDADQIAELAPRPGEHALTSRLRDGGSAVFGHDQSIPLVEQAIGRGETDGAELSLLVCAGEFPEVRHKRPLFLVERLAHDGVRGLLSGLAPGGGRLGVLRPLPEQVEDAYQHWEASIGVRPTIVGAASPYTDPPEIVAAAAAEVAATSDLVVLDCIGYDEEMRTAAVAAGGVPVVTVRSVAARLLASML